MTDSLRDNHSKKEWNSTVFISGSDSNVSHLFILIEVIKKKGKKVEPAVMTYICPE